ncbi:MAG: AAA family ATPase [Oscillospiraceae bacterium]|nr:AAA family ATPase [Oscillospiraceae bacterium]
MMIHKLTASFGKLENETLTLHDGLNVIYAPNESGKSTWCAFIRAMLYGVDSSARARSGYLPDKLRYAPWSGAPMEGSMDLTADRCDITIQRRTKSKSAPMREFSAVYTGTNVPVEGLNASNAGVQLTGVSRDVFVRSAFIEQGTVAVTGSPELEKRISSIVSTGDEQTSYSEADARLRTWQRKRRYNRRGLLPELEGKMDESKHLLEEMNGSAQNLALLNERLESAKRDCAQLEEAVAESRKRQRREAMLRLGEGRAQAAAASDAHDRAMEQLSDRREDLRRSAFAGRPYAEVAQETREDLQSLSELIAAAKKKVSFLPALLLFALAVGSAALYTVKQALPYALAFIILAAVLGVAAIVLLMRGNRLRRAAEQAAEERRRILKKYRAQSGGEIAAQLKDYEGRVAALADAEQAEQTSRAAWERARARMSDLEEQALSDLDFSSGSSEAARLGRELSAAREAAERLSAQIAGLNGRLSVMGDPLVLASDLSCMSEEYELIQAEYDAIALAIDTLRSADAELQSRFSPELGRVAAEYMAQMTGGRYTDVLINRDFSALTRTSSDAVARESEYLSAGTLDLLYLAVRLAVCELALPEGESCPLIIDDALVNLDETRQEQAMKLLAQIAKERQVILFSCREVK